MKILWCVNILLPDIAEAIGAPHTPLGGWMVSLSSDLAKIDGINLAVATIYSGKELKKHDVNNITYYLIPGGQKAMLKRSNEKLKDYWWEVAEHFKPDLLHLHGTEYSHGLALLEACPDIPAVVSIQGLLGVIQKYYYAGMEFSDVFLRPSFRDIIKLDPLWNNRRSFRSRAVFEREILCQVRHVIGRTTWDYSNVKAINPNIKYHHCDESLREPFYKSKWDISNVQRHSIFTTQAGYPIKGFHVLLKAVALLKRDYPDIQVFAAGYNLLGNSFKERLKIPGYGLYIKRLIKKLGLEDNVAFTGMLDAEGVVYRLLKSHVFVIPSAVENSPNSLAEAMLLGVPCIGSYTGGIPDMLENGNCGFLYPFMEEAMLAEYIRRIFESDDIALQFSQAVRESAHKRHDRKKITDTMVGIYRDIVSCPR
ncbi:glycosyltransferase family 4 protein [Desulfotomaculum nigrificans]|uniref:glycosyltransferase family 4 protein n=1 Tax=Desulfotomaculum nigrificans TaxID=1565 RepID=UPI0001FAEAE0|nr:glycosyltransferase family 4 protein [Desulfotomaculum nigrificans]